jgi:hypothetical protein
MMETTMNKAELREKRRRLQQDNRAYRTGVFVELPMEMWPDMDGRQVTVARVAVWRSREFLVQAIMEPGMLRLSVNRTELDASGNWKDGITWDELQAIKIMEPGMLRLSVNRTELDASGNWKDGITWDELQAIKSAVGYGDRDAVEAYPKNVDVVNVANIRHLWILPNHAALPVFWRKKEIPAEKP